MKNLPALFQDDAADGIAAFFEHDGLVRDLSARTEDGAPANGRPDLAFFPDDLAVMA